MDIRLDGRSALITGGTKGLGLAMAECFAASGANVAMLARGAEGLAAAKAQVRKAAPTNVGVEAIACDVRDNGEIERAWRQAESAFGHIDILVNNAGTSATGPFETITDEQWQHDLDLKVFAHIRFCRLALPGMKARRWGRIINVLNIGAKAPPAGRAPTTVSRAAGLALTKILAGECAPFNVLVNALMVGVFVTNQHREHHAKSGAKTSFEEHVKKIGANVPLGRMGDPMEFANLACFLASDAASYITGTAINADGGSSPVP